MVQTSLVDESVWTRALHDATATTRTLRFWFFSAVLGVVVSTSTLLALLKWGPANIWVVSGIPSAVLIGWLLTGIFSIVTWHLVRAPYRQRDEAWAVLSEGDPDEQVIKKLKETTVDFGSRQLTLDQALLERGDRLATGLGILDIPRTVVAELQVLGLVRVELVQGVSTPAQPIPTPAQNHYYLTGKGARILRKLRDRRIPNADEPTHPC